MMIGGELGEFYAAKHRVGTMRGLQAPAVVGDHLHEEHPVEREAREGAHHGHLPVHDGVADRRRFGRDAERPPRSTHDPDLSGLRVADLPGQTPDLRVGAAGEHHVGHHHGRLMVGDEEVREAHVVGGREGRARVGRHLHAGRVDRARLAAARASPVRRPSIAYISPISLDCWS